MLEINELIKEIEKRDRVITNVLTSIFATKLIRTGYGHRKIVVEELINTLDIHTTDLDNLCEHLQDQAISMIFDKANESKDKATIKAEKLAAELVSMLDGSYARNLKNEIRIAVDQKRIELLKQF